MFSPVRQENQGSRCSVRLAMMAILAGAVVVMGDD